MFALQHGAAAGYNRKKSARERERQRERCPPRPVIYAMLPTAWAGMAGWVPPISCSSTRFWANCTRRNGNGCRDENIASTGSRRAACNQSFSHGPILPNTCVPKILVTTAACIIHAEADTLQFEGKGRREIAQCLGRVEIEIGREESRWMVVLSCVAISSLFLPHSHLAQTYSRLLAPYPSHWIRPARGPKHPVVDEIYR